MLLKYFYKNFDISRNIYFWLTYFANLLQITSETEILSDFSTPWSFIHRTVTTTCNVAYRYKIVNIFCDISSPSWREFACACQLDKMSLLYTIWWPIAWNFSSWVTPSLTQFCATFFAKRTWEIECGWRRRNRGTTRQVEP